MPPPGVGSNHGRAKRDEVVICDLIADAAEDGPDGLPRWTYDEIAAAYGLPSGATVAQIMAGYIWAHVDPADRQRWVAGLLGRGRQAPGTALASTPTRR